MLLQTQRHWRVLLRFLWKQHVSVSWESVLDALVPLEVRFLIFCLNISLSSGSRRLLMLAASDLRIGRCNLIVTVSGAKNSSILLTYWPDRKKICMLQSCLRSETPCGQGIVYPDTTRCPSYQQFSSERISILSYQWSYLIPMKEKRHCWVRILCRYFKRELFELRRYFYEGCWLCSTFDLN